MAFSGSEKVVLTYKGKHILTKNWISRTSCFIKRITTLKEEDVTRSTSKKPLPRYTRQGLFALRERSAANIRHFSKERLQDTPSI